MATHRIGLGLLLTLALSLMLPACSDDEDTTLTPSPPPDLDIEVIVQPVQIEFGQSFEILLTITNNGGAASLETTCADKVGYRIINGASGMTIESPGACVPEVGALTFDAGETRDWRFHPSMQLAPSSYEIQAGIVEHEDTYPWPSKSLVVTLP